ncbi:MAG: CYTH domain-containing protein [Treponema sp.]|jgi:adenylate cyclase class 2|nr:CYTH domain-containing protein [Treponema sp.]
MGKHTEIELKARVPRWRDCRRRLTELAGGGSSLVKDDGYWFPAAAPGASGLRVRREHTGGEGQTAEHTLVTYKTKERREGIEINDEHEFEVSDGAVFEELLERLGLEKRIAKHKTGWVWRYGGINAELVKVSGGAKVGGAEAGGTKVGGAGFDGGTGGPEPPDSAGTKDLGWFLELEILSGPGGSDEAVAAARGRLLELLAQAGIGEADLESRYYSELLAGGVSRDGVFKSP